MVAARAGTQLPVILIIRRGQPCSGYIEQVLDAHEHIHIGIEQNGEIARVLRELFQEQQTHRVHPGSRQIVWLLLQYIEADLRSQERLRASTALLEKIDHLPLFSAEILAHIYSERGWAYFYLKEYYLALADFDRAFKHHSRYAAAYAGRGWAYRRLKEYQEALGDFDRAIELESNYAAAYNGRSGVYRELNQYQLAINNFESVLKLDPHYAWAYTSRGWIYWNLGEYERAIEDFDRSVMLDPQFADAYTGRGWAYKKLKDYQRASADFNRALELNPKDSGAYNGRGSVYRELKEYKLAISLSGTGRRDNNNARR